MRTAFITYEYASAGTGGAGTYARMLTAELARLGVDVTVFTRGEPRPDGSYRVLSVCDADGGAVAFWRSLPNAIRRAGGISSFDILHGSGVSDFSLRRVGARTFRIVTVHHVSAALISKGVWGFIQRARDIRGETGVVPMIERHVARRADTVITPTQETATQAIAAYGLDERRVVPIPHGVVVPELPSWHVVAQTRDRFAPSGERLILVVGRTEARKGTDLVLNAFARLSPAYRCRLIFAGTSSHEYEHLADKLGIATRVTFLGWVDDSTLADLYAAADIFVSASKLEGFGLALVEAMAAGLPVVASRTGIVASHLGPEIGAAVEIEDVDALAAGMGSLLTDPGRAEAVGRANRARASEIFDWASTARRTLEVYLRVAPRPLI